MKTQFQPAIFCYFVTIGTLTGLQLQQCDGHGFASLLPCAWYLIFISTWFLRVDLFLQGKDIKPNFCGISITFLWLLWSKNRGREHEHFFMPSIRCSLGIHAGSLATISVLYFQHISNLSVVPKSALFWQCLYSKEYNQSILSSEYNPLFEGKILLIMDS